MPESRRRSPFVERERRHCEDRQLREPFIGTNGAGGVEAVHFRHLHVHQHDVPGPPISTLSTA